MDYFLFLDESGDHDLGFVDKNFPLFLLCGCVMDAKAMQKKNTRMVFSFLRRDLPL